jgi:hypothetical protein
MVKDGKKGQGVAGKLGAPDHFLGFKLAFLVSKAALYQQCMDSNSIAKFYNKVTIDFIAKYGWDKPFNKEPAKDPPDPEDGTIDGSAQEPLSKEEVAEYAAMRGSCHFYHNPQGNCLHARMDNAGGLL